MALFERFGTTWGNLEQRVLEVNGQRILDVFKETPIGPHTLEKLKPRTSWYLFVALARPHSEFRNAVSILAFFGVFITPLGAFTAVFLPVAGIIGTINYILSWARSAATASTRAMETLKEQKTVTVGAEAVVGSAEREIEKLEKNYAELDELTQLQIKFYFAPEFSPSDTEKLKQLFMNIYLNDIKPEYKNELAERAILIMKTSKEVAQKINERRERFGLKDAAIADMIGEDENKVGILLKEFFEKYLEVSNIKKSVGLLQRSQSFWRRFRRHGTAEGLNAGIPILVTDGYTYLEWKEKYWKRGLTKRETAMNILKALGVLAKIDTKIRVKVSIAIWRDIAKYLKENKIERIEGVPIVVAQAMKAKAIA